MQQALIDSSTPDSKDFELVGEAAAWNKVLSKAQQGSLIGERRRWGRRASMAHVVVAPPGFDALEGEFIFIQDAGGGDWGEYLVAGCLRGGAGVPPGVSAVALTTDYPDGENFLWVEVSLRAGQYRVAVGHGLGR